MLPTALVQVCAILFGCAFTIATCYSAGRVLLRLLDIRLYSQEVPLIAFVSGSACVSLGVFALLAIGAAYPWVMLVLGSALIVIAHRTRLPSLPSLPPVPAFWKWTFLAIFTAYTVFYSPHAMGPEYSPDGSTYHLGYVARYIREHEFGRITTSFYANLSEGLEMLFVVAFAFGRHSAAAMTHFAFFIALTLGIVTFARRFDIPAAGYYAAILIYASPAFGWDGTIAYNDVAAACVTFYVFYVLQIWAAERGDSLLPLAGLLAGFAYAVKYTAAVALIYAVGFTIWKSRSLRKTGLVCAAALLSIAPWAVKNSIVIGNPFSPFMNAWFPNPCVSVAFERAFTRRVTHVDGYTPLARFLDVAYRAGPARSILGLAFLLAPVAVLALRSQTGRRLLTAATVVGLVCGINVETRFLLPAVPFLAIAMGLAFMRMPFVLAAIAVLHAGLCWPTILKRYSDEALRVRHFLPKQALRIEPEDSTLSYRLPGYRMARMIEQLVPPNARVFCTVSPPQAYTSRELLIYYESTPNIAAMEILAQPFVPDTQPKQRITFTLDPRELRAIRVLQMNGSATDEWSVAEMQVALGGAALLRSQQWKIEARPNPFEAGDAFDGQPVTHWKSRQPLFRGMLIGVDFGQRQRIDSVFLDGPDQYGIALRLEGRGEGGGWDVLAAAPARSETLPVPDLRRAATAELKHRGITHLLLGSSFPGAADMASHAADWSLRFLGEAEQTRLYAIE